MSTITLATTNIAKKNRWKRVNERKKKEKADLFFEKCLNALL